MRRFSDMEVFVEIHENVRGEDVFVIQSTSYPANDHLMELLVSLDALKRSSARRVTAVIPYYGYARQDRKSGPRTPISAKLVANMITAAGADRVLTLDLHAGADPGLLRHPDRQSLRRAGAGEGHPRPSFEPGSGHRVARCRRGRARPADRAPARRRSRDHRQAPRAGRRLRGHEHHRRRRRAPLHSVDDIVDSAGTLCNAAEALIDSGASAVYAYVTHGVLSGGAVARVAASPIEMLVMTDSIVATEAVRAAHNIRQLTIAPLMAEAIRRISEERSVSSLFD